MRLALAFLILIASIVPASAQRPCDQTSTFQHDIATGPVEIVVGKPDQRIYPCGFMLTQKGNSLDFQMWSAVAGSNCVPVTFWTPRMSLPTDVAFTNRIENAGPSLPYNNSLCIQTFGTGSLTGAIYWAQF
jgi:hypothetical protein